MLRSTLLFGVLLLLFCGMVSHAQKVEFYMDENNRFAFKPIENPQARAAASSQVKITTSLDNLFPESKVHVQVSFDPSLNLNEVRFFSIYVFKTNEINTRFSKYIIYTNKAINAETRTLTTTLGGLKPNETYSIKVNYNSPTPDYSCSGETSNTYYFTTAREPLNRPKKLLFIIDKDLEGDTDIDQALSTYEKDITNYYPITFERIYLENQNPKKQDLVNKIRQDYEDVGQPLRYLFFIGSNAATNIQRRFLNPTNNTPINTYSDLSINFYTQVYNPEYIYNPEEDQFLLRKYSYCSFNGLPANDIGNTTTQSNSYEIAYGALLPNGPTPKKDYILNYFSKLHRFKIGQITFNKSVLFADTQLNDGASPATLSQTISRWQSNDTIQVPQKYGLDYHGYDPVWHQDYTSKLANKSYEIALYMGHGAPTYHYYGIANQTIRDLPQLNTMLFDFHSCSVGAFNTYDYVAGAYLEKGNTLFVKAFTTPVFLAIINYRSPLIDYFHERSMFWDISTRAFFGDAYLHGSSNAMVQIQLGDPLLQLDPPCSSTNLTVTTNTNTQIFAGAKEHINARNKLYSPARGVYQAGNSITLERGFEANKGTTFEAKIQGCPQ